MGRHYLLTFGLFFSLLSTLLAGCSEPVNQLIDKGGLVKVITPPTRVSGGASDIGGVAVEASSDRMSLGLIYQALPCQTTATVIVTGDAGKAMVQIQPTPEDASCDAMAVPYKIELELDEAAADVRATLLG